MSKFGESQAVTRFEDRRFLTCHGRYVDDIASAGAWHVLFLRSPIAHAKITGLDVDATRGMPGIRAVISAAELEAGSVNIGLDSLLVKNRDGSQAAAPLRPALANDRARFVGEPVAAVVAETVDQARDAIDAIGFEYEDLPANMELARGGDAIHSAAPGNRAFDWAYGDEAATHAAFAHAAHRVKLRVVENRITVNSMEPRGAFAEWEGGRLHLAFVSQGVWGVKDALARALGLDPAAVRGHQPGCRRWLRHEGRALPRIHRAGCRRADARSPRPMVRRARLR